METERKMIEQTLTFLLLLTLGFSISIEIES